MEDLVSQAKAEFLRAKDRLTRDLETTPDDKINWSPSPNSRTPVHLVAHAAMSTPAITDILLGKPFPFATTAEMDATLRKKEKEFTSRKQALDLLEQSSKDFLAWLDTLTPEQLASTAQTPMGPIPMAVGITINADHLRNHAGQLEYLQTTWGDHEWRM